MSKNEKEAIKTVEYLKTMKWYSHAFDNGTEILTQEEKSDIDIVLNLIEKQQKELQQEKEKNKKLQIRCKELIEEKQELNTALLYDNIHKDKIRAKIKELEKLIETNSLYEECWNKIEVLKELLERRINMPWISENRYLTQAEKENNANIIIAYYRSQGIEDRAIAGILGNIDAESTFSPTLTEVGGGGYGLVQWTPVSVLQSHCNITGLHPYTSGDIQIQVILREMRATSSDLREWYTSSGFISNYYNFGASSDMIGITADQFLSNSMNWDADKMCIMFMAGYERPLASEETIHWQYRKERALFWYQYMGGQPGTFTPRLDDTGIVGDFHYYSQNPFYQSGYGMPNCTCYAWGRFWEIGDPGDSGANRPDLPMGNGGQWFAQAVADGIYQTGQTPQLGAVICFSDNNGGAGHVAIVEEIASDGTITCSNSAYQGTFFFLSHITPVNGRYDWSHYTCQGFIYNPYAFQPIPPTPTHMAKNKWLMAKSRKINIRL